MINNNTKKKLYIVAGPTGIGKTDYSIGLAKKVGGEIISLDSIQIYKGLDIGSGKITKEKMQGIPHYMIDVLSPKDTFNIKDFKDMANKYINIIYQNNKVPILVGGTGFYINAVLYDTEFEHEDENELYSIRKYLYDLLDKNGIEYIYSLLKKVDKASCEKIHINNHKRVIRAYEYYLIHKKPISKHNELEKAKESKYNFEFLVLDMQRDILYNRINNRVDSMIDNGLLDEIKRLIDQGVDKKMQSMQAIGYKELFDYVYENKNDKEELDLLINNIKLHTRQYAKRQITWFKSQKNIQYIKI